MVRAVRAGEWERLKEPVVERVRLWVHEENLRAEAFYRALGFVATGLTHADPKNPGAVERAMALLRA
ncbi:N-acetyltransferase [Streptomyces sp. NRRL S-1813]|uniref:N-acetyltransferase n=1 Tax=Streptomyces sp. NRRL S-1813 TaxID=1463888 RepID=UPI0004CC0427